jgi:soluble lytic murein transglycosylase-like protein
MEELMTRTLIVIAGYLVLGVAYLFQQPAPPEPIKIVPVTEAQIKEGVRHDQKAKAIKKAIATARSVYWRNHVSTAYAEITGRVAVETGLSPRLLAAVIVVESHGHAQAKDGRGSIGLMQVNARIWGHRKELTDPETNIRIGAHILKMYIDKYGINKGLHAYNGFGNPTDEYAQKVFDAEGALRG